MKTVLLAQLLPGDVIVSFVGKPDEKPDLSNAALWANHASIVSALAKDGAVHSIHNTNTGNRGENRRFLAKGPVDKAGRWSGTMRSDVVVPSAPKLPSEEESGQQMRVLRCKRQELAKRAAHYAQVWDGYEIPYSEGKLAKAKAHEKTYGTNATLVKGHRELFRQTAKFRAIKYAARRNGFLCYPDGLDSDPGLKHGMFCSQLVAVCFQVAGLESLVDAAKAHDLTEKVTDKKVSPKLLSRFARDFEGSKSDFESYIEYTRHLHSVDPYELKLPAEKAAEQKDYKYPKSKRFTYSPSIAHWKSTNVQDITNTDWAAQITEGMMLDNKTIMPTGLFACLDADKKGWEDLGYLVGPRAFSESHDEKQNRLRAKAHLTNRARSKFPRG